VTSPITKRNGVKASLIFGVRVLAAVTQGDDQIGFDGPGDNGDKLARHPPARRSRCLRSTGTPCEPIRPSVEGR
jgi:hypothetical protein